MKFLSLDLIESLSHSAGYIRTESIGDDYQRFCAKIAQHGCSILFTSNNGGLVALMPSGVISVDANSNLLFTCALKELRRIYDWMKNSNCKIIVHYLDGYYTFDNIHLVKGMSCCKIWLRKEQKCICFIL